MDSGQTLSLASSLDLSCAERGTLSYAASAAATASCSLQAAPAAMAVWHSSGLIALWRRSTSLLRIAMSPGRRG